MGPVSPIGFQISQVTFTAKCQPWSSSLQNLLHNTGKLLLTYDNFTQALRRAIAGLMGRELKEARSYHRTSATDNHLEEDAPTAEAW